MTKKPQNLSQIVTKGKITIKDAKNIVKRLKKFNAWRRGEIECTIDELGMTAKDIGLDIEFACLFLETVLNGEYEKSNGKN